MKEKAEHAFDIEPSLETESPEVQEEAVRKREFNMTDFLLTLWRRKWLMIIIIGVFIGGSVALALLLPQQYQAIATVIPAGSGGSSTLSQYASLASTFGVNLPSGLSGSGGPAPDQQIMDILQSRSICEQLVREFNLQPIIVPDPKSIGHRNPFNYAVNQLQTKHITVTEDQTNSLITFTVNFYDRQLAQKIAARAIEILEKILNDQNLRMSVQSSKSLEQQIAEQEKKMTALQNELAAFQKDTKIISASGQVTSAMAIYGGLLQQQLSLEVTLSRLASGLSPDNPQVTSTKAQLDAVNKQIAQLEGTTGVGSFSMGNAPDQIVEYGNIQSELNIASSIYAGLLASYENQKLQEAQSQLFVQVVDPPIVPDIALIPNKKLIVAGGTLGGILIAIFAAVLVGAIGNIASDVKTRKSKSNPAT